MELTVNEYVVRVVVVAPQERIDALNAPVLRQRLHALLDDGASNLVIDLSVVPFMDSAGMAVLVSALKRARSAGGDVRLVWPKAEAARRILNLTQLDRVFGMAETAADAVKGF
jgi:anti-sigma B factor antagonist